MGATYRAAFRRVSPSDRQRQSRSGLTILEVVITTLVLSIFLAGSVTALLAAQNAFLESQIVSQLRLRAQNAMERVVALSSQAVTTDPKFSLLKPTSGVDSHCLRFRLIQSVSGNGQPVYDDTARVYVYGPDNGVNPCTGLIIGRGPTLATIYAKSKGADNVLGTTDDDTSTALAGNLPAVELLIPNTFAPQNGEMFTINVTPAPIGRLLTLTFRLNARNSSGTFIFPNDLVLTQRVALRQ